VLFGDGTRARFPLSTSSSPAAVNINEVRALPAAEVVA